jgi:hypothetical protein
MTDNGAKQKSAASAVNHSTALRRNTVPVDGITAIADTVVS